MRACRPILFNIAMAASHLPASLSSATVAELRNYMRAHGISGISKPKEQLRAAISDYHAHRDELLQLALGITPIANIQKHFPHIKVTGAEQTQDRILQHIRQTI